MSELLPPELKDQLPKLSEQEGADDPTVFAKFLFPASGWIWLVTEGQSVGDDFMFFGYVIGFEAEWGYFTLRELEGVNVRGLIIERDDAFEPCALSDCLSQSTSSPAKN